MYMQFGQLQQKLFWRGHACSRKSVLPRRDIRWDQNSHAYERKIDRAQLQIPTHA
jgi:hypothetical protein